MPTLPDWLRVDSLLPTLLEFKEQSNAGATHIRSKSSVHLVDEALTAFWSAWVASRAAPLTPGPPTKAQAASGELWRTQETKRLLAASSALVVAAKAKLDALITACDVYVEKQTALSADELDRAMGYGDRAATNELAAGAARARIANITDEKRKRVAPTLGMRYLAKKDRARVAEWTSGPPPQLSFVEAWSSATLLPPLEVWKMESSGGPDKSWTLRSRSKIVLIDAALTAWWKAFMSLDREAAAGTALEALIAAIDAYILHKAEPKTTARAQLMARTQAAKRLLSRCKREQARLAEWKLLIPPTLEEVRLAPGEVVDELAGSASMELRTMLPTLDLWKEQSSVFAAIRSTSEVVELVDEPLTKFWKTLLTTNREASLHALAKLSRSAAAYLYHKEYSTSGTYRVDAVISLRTMVDAEYARFETDWPKDGTLPPIIVDNDAGDDPAEREAVADEVNELAKEIDASALSPVAPNDVIRALRSDTTGEPDGDAKLAPLARVLNERNQSPWFGRSRCFAQVLHEPRAASRELLTLYASDKKWVTRQMAAIQSCSVIKYPQGIEDAALKKFPTDTTARNAHKKRYEDFFERVISVGDHIARRLNSDPTLSAWKILDEMGWTTAARPIVLPMLSVITLLHACKWKESKTSVVVGGVRGYGVKLAIATGASLGMTCVTTTESVYKIVESSNYIASANIAAGGAGLSVFGAVGGAIGLPLSAYQIYTSVKDHHALSTMLERFAVLQTVSPQLVDVLDTSSFFMRLRVALLGKVGRRQTRAKIGGIGAAAAIGGTVTGTCLSIWATATIANVWNPVGWSLAAIGAVASVGLLIYKIKRRSVQEAALVDARTKYAVPSFVKTRGEYDRYMIADLIYRAALNDGSVGDELLAIGYALLFLVFGGSIRDARANALAMGHAGIMAFLKG